MEIFYKDTYFPPFGCQTLETMEPKKLEFPQETIYAGGRKGVKAGASQGGGGGCLLEGFTQFRVCQTTMQERLELIPP